MRIFRKHRALIALAGLAVAVVAASPRIAVAAAPPSTVILVLIDSSASVSSPATKALYSRCLGLSANAGEGTVLGEVKPDTRLIADKITENSLSSGVLPVDVAFPRRGWIDNPKAYAAKSAKARRTASDGLPRILASRTASQTDILGALSLAGKVLNGSKYKGAKNKVLVVFTDGIHQTNELDFLSYKFTDDTVRDTLDKERELDRLANLSGVKVWMAGVAAQGTAGTRLSSSQYAGIKKFWLEYFKAAGARISSSNYGPTLLNFGL